jgi:putative DNA primase/helicase
MSTMLAPDLGRIPYALRAYDQWCGWKLMRRLQKDTGKDIKVPVQPNGAMANTVNAKTWATFDEVKKAYQAKRCRGVGFITSTDDPFVLIDIDKVRDLKTGKIAPWAAAIVQTALAERAYVELSPSGTGFHVIGEGPQGFAGQKANGVELYCAGRFFTITGSATASFKQKRLGRLGRTLDLVTQRLQIDGVRQASPRHDGEALVKGKRPYPAHWTGARILKLAYTMHNGDKLKRLLAGYIGDYGNDASSADMACASMLGFWFWLDPDVVERVMLASKLARPKWDTRRKGMTYLRYTINAALSGKTDYYGIDRRRGAP